MISKNYKRLLLLSVVSFLCLSYFFLIPKKSDDSDFSNDQNSLSKTLSAKPIVLDYYIWDDEESYISPVVNAYNSLQSHVFINLHLLTSTSYDVKLKDLFSTKAKVDLFGIKGNAKMVQYKDQKLIYDITDFIKNNDLDVTAYGSMFNDISVGDRYYGLPTRNTCWVLVYNKDIFDKAGITYPGQLTWEEYRNVAITLTTESADEKTYGGYWVPWCYNFAAIVRSSYLIDDDLSLAKESLSLLGTFYNLDDSHVSYEDMKNKELDARKVFESGTIAMMPQGEWIVNMLLQDEKSGLTDVKWDIAPMPVFKGQEPGITWGQYQFVSIGSDTSYPREAFDFMQFLCGREGARIFAENGIIHAYSNDQIKEIYIKAVGKESASLFFEAKKVQEEPAISGYQDILEAFQQCSDDYFLGVKSLEEAMSTFESTRSTILSNSP